MQSCTQRATNNYIMSIFARLNKDSTVQLWDKEKKKILEKTAEKLVILYTNIIVFRMYFLFMGSS